MKKFASLVLTVAIASAMAACGAVSNKGNATPTPSGSPTPTGTPSAITVKDIQTGTVPVNTTVTLTDVIVTAVNATTGDFYVQDAGGGAHSGIYIFDKFHHNTGLAVGDKVTLAGMYTEYQGSSTNPWAAAVSEIAPDSITQTGTGTPVADAIPATGLAVFKDTSGVPNDDSWEGCLVTITGTTPVFSVGMNFGEYAVGASAAYVRVDKQLTDTFEPRLVGENMTLTGVVSYAFNHYHLQPRSVADAVGDGTNAPVAKVVSDLVDSTAAGHPVPGQLVTITDGYVTAVSTYTNSQSQTKTSFWIQTATNFANATAGQYQGIYVEDSRYTNPTILVGDKVTLTGKYVQYGSTTVANSIMLFADHAVVTPTVHAQALTPLNLSVTTLGAASTAKPYEGVLVNVNSTTDAGLKVVDAPDTYKEYTVGVTSKVYVGKAIFDTSTGKTANLALTKAQGPLYSAFGKYYIEPTVATDVQ